MKKVLLPVITLMLSACLYAHTGVHFTGKDFKSTPARVDMSKYAVSDGSSAEAIATFITRKITNLQGKEIGLSLFHNSTSLAAYHYSFHQTYQGIPIYLSEVKVNVSKKNVIFSILDNSYDVSKWQVNTTPFDYQQLSFYTAYTASYFNPDVTAETKASIAYDEATATPFFCYDVLLRDRAGHFREVLVAKDRIIYERDAAMYSDSTVTCKVFNPDPLTTSQHVYAGAYKNYNDSDITELNAQRETKMINVDFSNDTFYLRNKYVEIKKISSGSPSPVTSTIPDFSFTRSQPGFEDVMTYYHLNVNRKYLHDLGFNMADTLLTGDPHGTTADQSFFIFPHTIYWGTGGVADAEDADVLIHEYTHFLSWNANGTSGGNEERAGLDEGTADYNATSYSRDLSPFNWQWVFNWDGHNEFWDGRVVNNTTQYASVQHTRYKYGTVWASALMGIWGDINRGVTDSLVFETLYSLGSTTTLPQAAQMLVQSDSMLFGGMYHCVIVDNFAAHGITVTSSCDPLGVVDVTEGNAARFTAYPDGFRAEPYDATASMDITVYNTAGQHLYTYHNITSVIKPELPAGIYLIDVSASGIHKGYKWALVK